MVVLGGCVADAEPPAPPPEIPTITASSELVEEGMDVCALAAELPFDDICSLICDPDAMATRMADDGNERGQCYQLYCSLPHDEHVVVGVCLAP
jgi:hypothetical protein